MSEGCCIPSEEVSGVALPSMSAAFCSRASSSAALGCCTDPPALCTPDAMVASPTCAQDHAGIVSHSVWGFQDQTVEHPCLNIPCDTQAC